MEHTRHRILQAYMECLADQTVEDTAISDVAARAGVSERTVYRHYPTKVELMAAAGAWINDTVFNYIHPKSVDDLAAVYREVCRRFDESPNLAYAIALGRIGRSVRQGFRAEMLEHNRQTLAPVTDHLGEEEVRRAEAVVAYLDNVLAWTVMREEFGLDADQVADAVEWVLTLVIGDLKRRNRRAAKESP